MDWLRVQVIATASEQQKARLGLRPWRTVGHVGGAAPLTGMELGLGWMSLSGEQERYALDAGHGSSGSADTAVHLPAELDDVGFCVLRRVLPAEAAAGLGKCTRNLSLLMSYGVPLIDCL